MISDRDNELMCRVGPETAMGAAMRRFWVPACLSSELPEPDGEPLHVELLGESFVAFRDSNGTVGLLDEYCCHRGASLTVGRVENCGIRCIYHGWLFAADGTVLETPNVPDPRFKERFKAKSYPVREAGGLIWTYLGPVEKMPPLPDFPWINAEPGMRLNTLTMVGCNYVQVLEGLLDSSHLSVLHSTPLQQAASNDLAYARFTQHMRFDAAPRIESEETEFGAHYAAIRMVEGKAETRVATFISPFYALHPHGDLTIIIVPLGDTRSAFYNVWWDGAQRFGEDPLRSAQTAMIGISDAEQEAFGLTRRTFDGPDHPRRANGFRQDRASMRGGHFSGVPTLMMEDVLVGVSAGPLRSRAYEHLSTADMAIAHMYKVLLRSARNVLAGGDPVHAGQPVGHIAARRETLEPGTDWRTLVPANRGTRRAAAG